MHLLIPTYQRPTMLARLLESIAVAEIPPGLEMIYIIENGSRVASEVARSYEKQLPIQYVQIDEGNK